jgi:hypothetical protein
MRTICDRKNWQICVVFLGITLCLGGCAGHLSRVYATRCQGYGFQAGTAAFAQCMQVEDHRTDAVLSGLAGSLQQTGQSWRPGTLRCTTNTIGGTAFTQCY